MGDQPAVSMNTDLHKSETRLRDAPSEGGDLQNITQADSGEILINMLKEGI